MNLELKIITTAMKTGETPLERPFVKRKKHPELFETVVSACISRMTRRLESSKEDLRNKNIPEALWGYIWANGDHSRLGCIFYEEKYLLRQMESLKTARIYWCDVEDMVALAVDIRDKKTLEKYMGEDLDADLYKEFEDRARLMMTSNV